MPVHCSLIFYNTTATPETYTLSLHDALPISSMPFGLKNAGATYQRTVQNFLKEQIGRNVHGYVGDIVIRSEEHTSELQSPMYLVCRLLIEKKKHELKDDQCRKNGGTGYYTPN